MLKVLLKCPEQDKEYFHKKKSPIALIMKKIMQYSEFVLNANGIREVLACILDTLLAGRSQNRIVGF